MTSLINGENIWVMWALVIGITTIAFWLEQRFTWAAKISSVLLALIMALILVNTNIAPTSSPVYSALGSYILPLAIPLLLFQSDLRKIIKGSGKLLIIFVVAGIFSIIGGVICGTIFHGALGDQTAGYVAVEVGADIGGSVNLVAMASTFNVDESIMNASLIIGNLIIIIWTAAMIAIPNTKFFRKHYRHEYVDKFEATVGEVEEGKTNAAKFWSRHDISLLDLAKCMAITFAVNAATQLFCGFVNASGAPDIIKTFFGSIYLVMTLFTVILVTAFPKVFENIHGATELGTILITMWFVQVGAGARIMDVIALAPAVLGFKILMAAINIGGVLLVGKFLKWNVEECLTASNASLGGPTTAAAYVIGKGWSDLIVPATLVGLFGYIIGNYFAVITANMFL